MAFLSSTKTSLFASGSHLLTGVHITSFLVLFAVKFLILTFSRLENHFSIITLFFFNNNIFLPQFPPELCKQLNLSYLSTSFQFPFRPLSKILFPRNFNFILLGNYIWLLNFLVNPSCTATDKYCHITPYHFCQLAIIDTKIDLTILSIHQSPLSIFPE